MNWLRIYNPWWAGREAIERDEKVRRWEESRVKVRPGLYEEIMGMIRSGRPFVYVFRGPRQVGKSTLLKLIIRDLLREGWSPDSILYLPLDAPKIVDSRDFYEALMYFLRRARARGVERAVIFIDEASALIGWDKVLKGLIDSGELERSAVVVTGSHALDVLRGEERLGGRKGEYAGAKTSGIMYPLSFGEVASAFGVRGERPAVRDIFANPRAVEDWYALNADRLAGAFDSYLLTGGYPVALDQYLKEGRIRREVYDVYVELLVKDAMRYELSEKYVLALVDVLSEKLAGRVSLNNLARDADLRSHTVVARYLEYLEAAYATFSVHRLDVARKRADMRKERKVYFLDPFIFHACRAYVWAREDPFEASSEWLASEENRARLVESVVASHALRAVPPEPWRRIHALTYYAEDGEVDFVLTPREEPMLLEVKWRTGATRPSRALYRLKGHLGARALILTREELELDGEIPRIPVPLFLALRARLRG